ncbi:hypothetical protein GCM10019059_10100 [Camelimonas fluminis]|nr:hypothetical protein GCM10019059_10100 [Camelimonas fluminis]
MGDAEGREAPHRIDLPDISGRLSPGQAHPGRLTWAVSHPDRLSEGLLAKAADRLWMTGERVIRRRRACVSRVTVRVCRNETAFAMSLSDLCQSVAVFASRLRLPSPPIYAC